MHIRNFCEQRVVLTSPANAGKRYFVDIPQVGAKFHFAGARFSPVVEINATCTNCVPAQTLDEIVDSAVTLLKIDAEGAVHHHPPLTRSLANPLTHSPHT